MRRLRARPKEDKEKNEIMDDSYALHPYLKSLNTVIETFKYQ